MIRVLNFLIYPTTLLTLPATCRMDAANRRDRNSIWANLWRWLGQRFFSLVIVLAIAFLLPVSLAVSAAMAGVAHYLQGPELTWTLFSRGLEVAVSILVITFLFAMLFRYVPDAEIHWRDV